MNPERKAREFLRDRVRREVDFRQTAQARGLPAPPVEKPLPEGAQLIDLPRPGSWRGIEPVTLEQAIAARRSRRDYLPEPFTLDEISFLLWACQGARGRSWRGHAFRTVPSAGCRHALETYLAVRAVAGLEKGLYRFLPLRHRLTPLPPPGPGPALAEAALGQSFLATAGAVFIWTAIPERMEWRYGAASAKVIALDAGHACQNLYLACGAVASGACAVAAYDQDLFDSLLGVDGEDEFTVYLASAGKVDPGKRMP